jgi:hypothetical protein
MRQTLADDGLRMSEAGRGSLALCAAVMLGVAVMNWEGQTFQVGVLIAAALLGGYAIFGRSRRAGESGAVILDAAGRYGVLLSVVIFLFSYLTLIDPDGPTSWLGAFVLAAPIVCLGTLIGAGRGGRVAWYGLFAWYVVVVGWLLAATTNGPVIDVHIFQVDSVAALARGSNPFSITFSDPYAQALSDRFYGEGVSVGGVLQFGYPYFPLSLLAIAPFEWFLGDFRIAHAVAMLVAAFAISLLSMGAHAYRAATIFLLAAPVPFILRFGWIDSLVVLAAVAVVWSTRAGRGASYASGVLFAVKQTSALFVIPSVLTIPRPWTRRLLATHFVKAGLVFGVLTIPFAVWDPSGFMRSVVVLQAKQPFRPDSIAIPALFPSSFASLPWVVSVVLPMVVVLTLSAFVVRRSQTGAQGFALASAFILIVAFAVSKQAFANYYVVVLALLCAAAAVARVGVIENAVDERSMDQPVPSG